MHRTALCFSGRDRRSALILRPLSASSKDFAGVAAAAEAEAEAEADAGPCRRVDAIH